MFSLYGLMLFPLLPRVVESLLIIIFTALTLLTANFIPKKIFFDSFLLRKGFLFFSITSVFFIYFFGLFYSTNINESLSHLVRVIPIILFPLIFGIFKLKTLDVVQINNLKTVFIGSIFIGLLYLNIRLFNVLYLQKNTFWETRQIIENITDVHGTYLSLWISFGVLILFSFLKRDFRHNKVIVIVDVILIAFFIYWQSIIGARMPYFLTITLSLIFITLQFRFRARIVLVLSGLLITVLLLKTYKATILNRIELGISSTHSFPKGDYALEFKNISSEDIRKGILFCSWALVKESPLIGYGVGDVQTLLNNCYVKNEFSNVYQKFLYNTHNQYLQVLLSGGVFALVLFLMSFLLPLYISYRKSDFLVFALTILISTCCLTENIINRHDGIIFYSLFNSLLIFQNNKKNEKSLSA